ncbi:MAG: diguanylate cyclase [Chloroherpetonaceae bacterium]|nr:diguanylate cyclase [Chthonomonadaceae bacterium]MDW8208349.1 diguanylate cyclase [Chloroherpetonaceae bacterium]
MRFLHCIAAAESEQQVVSCLLEQIAPGIGASACLVALINDEGTGLQAIGASEGTPEVPGRWRQVSLDADHVMATCVREGSPAGYLHTLPQDSRVCAEFDTPFSPECRSIWIQPMRLRDRAIGALCFGFAKSDPGEGPVQETLQDVALICALALERVRLYRRERELGARVERERLGTRRLQEVLDTAQIGNWEIDVATGAIYWSEALFRILDVDPAQGVPDCETQCTLFHPDDVEQLRLCLNRAVSEKAGYAIDLRRVGSDGCVLRWVHAVGKPVTDAQGQVVRLVGTLMDITERKRYEQELEAAHREMEQANRLLEQQILLVQEQAVAMELQKHELEAMNRRLEALATVDGLTGIYNHRTFQERLTEEYHRFLRHGMPLSLILMDVDHFKKYNDTFGHPEGDRVLRQVAHLLQANSRSTDFVARYGGEEFAVLMPTTDAEGALRAAERLRSAIEQAEWPLRPVTGSFGVATLVNYDQTPDALIAAADRALYLSKQRGRNCATHARDLDDSAETYDGDLKWYEEMLHMLISAQVDTTYETGEQFRNSLIDALDRTIQNWANLIDLRDRKSRGRSKRLADLTERLARHIGLGGQELINIRWGAMLHDIGKLGLTETILRRSRPLSPEEQETLEQHPARAHALLAPMACLNAAADIPYCHHERWDGKGYPRGLKEDEIPLSARLFAVVEMYDTLRSGQPDRRCLSPAEARARLKKAAGKQLDPRAVHAFLQLLETEDVECLYEPETQKGSRVL